MRPNPDEANCIATAMIENGDAPANDAPAGPLSISDETTAAIADCVDAKQWLERLLTPGVGDETANREERHLAAPLSGARKISRSGYTGPDIEWRGRDIEATSRRKRAAFPG